MTSLSKKTMSSVWVHCTQPHPCLRQVVSHLFSDGYTQCRSPWARPPHTRSKSDSLGTVSPVIISPIRAWRFWIRATFKIFRSLERGFYYLGPPPLLACFRYDFFVWCGLRFFGRWCGLGGFSTPCLVALWVWGSYRLSFYIYIKRMWVFSFFLLFWHCPFNLCI
jgi:hypothetical protein